METAELILFYAGCAIASIAVSLMLGYGLAAWIKPLRRFYCWLGWHSHGYEPLDFDGASVHARCKWCRGVGMVDSQGNLFSVKHESS